MASTATNKQPLLVDRVLHYVVNLDTSINDGIDVTGANTATLLVDSTREDGAIIEDVYAISRSASAYKINLYLSIANDYLRPNQAMFIGQLSSATTAGERSTWEDMPKTLVPAPQVGDEPTNRALYVPKGYALWAARDSSVNVTDGPIVGCQGGWY